VLAWGTRVELGVGKAVDPGPGRARLVASQGDRPAAVVGAVSRHVDDAAARAKWTDWKQRCRVIDGAADRGAGAEQLARRTLDRSGKRGGGLLVAEARPPHHLNLQRRPRPLHHGHADPPV